MKVIWQGWFKLQTILEGYELALSLDIDLWSRDRQLIASFEVESGKTHRTWTLTSTDYNADVNSFFAKRADYQATDYADIGDDHTDPFLTKMVTQGFIEAGASGFYNDKGHALEGEHSH